MNTPEEREIEAEFGTALQAMGLLRAGERLSLFPLGGGVSCDVYRADADGRTFCVKRALARLRVAAEWLAPPERAASEVAWMRLVSTIEPKWVPRVLGEDRARHLFAMEYFPPQSHAVWKSELARGQIDVAFAGVVGTALARIHATTAGRADVAAQFANNPQFHALRIEPYLLFAASKSPEVADLIHSVAGGVEHARIALMHGDVSPKNILCGPAGPIFLDAETTCYGDPVFDFAFCLNHLFLKCVWHPQRTAAYLDAFSMLKASYLAGVTWEEQPVLEARATRLLPALLLARVDGKSPVEYLTAQDEKDFVRRQALILLRDASDSLDAIRARWTDAVGEFTKTRAPTTAPGSRPGAN